MYTPSKAITWINTNKKDLNIRKAIGLTPLFNTFFAPLAQNKHSMKKNRKIKKIIKELGEKKYQKYLHLFIKNLIQIHKTHNEYIYIYLYYKIICKQSKKCRFVRQEYVCSLVCYSKQKVYSCNNVIKICVSYDNMFLFFFLSFYCLPGP